MGVSAALAGRAPAAVLPVIGRDRLLDVERLGLDARLRLADTPRDAAVLLVAGEVGGRRDALALLHDQLPHPRATLWWGVGPPSGWAGARAGDDPAADAARLWRALASGERASEPDRLPDEPPNPWRGVGPHGQGGKGMMGGTPYGRPMAMPDEDGRDGLMLDAYALRAGPFLGPLPPGLRLEATLQGDVVQSVRPKAPPLPQAGLDGAPLVLAARMLRLLGLPAQAERCVRAHVAGRRGPRALVRLSGALGAVPPGLAPLADGSNARERLSDWLDGHPALDPGGEETLEGLLAGLEWHAAALALASLPPAALDRLCADAMAQEEGGGKGHEHGHGGGHGEGGHVHRRHAARARPAVAPVAHRARSGDALAARARPDDPGPGGRGGRAVKAAPPAGAAA